jgi:hypothetical protein
MWYQPTLRDAISRYSSHFIVCRYLFEHGRELGNASIEGLVELLDLLGTT